MPHKSRLGCLVIDCRTDDLAEAARFWSGALGFETHTEPGYPEYVELRTPEGHIEMMIQAVDHPPRVHLDIQSDDREAERQRLLDLGAKVVDEIDDDPKHWTIMEAPTGHRFCIVKPSGRDFDATAKTWDDA